MRSIFTFILGLVIFVAFIGYLLVSAVTDNLLSADFYTDALADNEVYSRFYDQVLDDEEFADTRNELLGGLEIPQEDIIMVVKSVLPPSYLQAEVERAVNGTIDYLNEDAETLEVYIDLATPMENAKNELLAYVDDQIDELEVVPIESEEELRQFIDDTFRGLEEGIIPSTVPALGFIPVEERLRAYDQALASLEDDPNIPQAITDALKTPETEQAIRTALSAQEPAGDENLKVALKEATAGLTSPLIDEALSKLRRELVTPEGVVCESLAEGADLTRCTRLDIVQLAVDNTDQYASREQLEEELDDVRKWIGRGKDYGGRLALLVMAVAIGLLAIVHLPRLSASMRWPAIILALTGAVFLILGLALNSTLPDRADSAVERFAEESDLPADSLIIASDVVTDMAREIGSGIIGPSSTLLVIAGILFVASFFLRFIPFMLVGSLRR